MNKKIFKTALISSLFFSQLALADGMHEMKLKPTDKYHATLIKDVTFSSFGGWKHQESLRMDIISPTTDKPTPCIVYITGNAFRYAERSLNLPMLTDFARDGYTVAIIDYRASMLSHWPAQIEDSKTAVRFLRANAKKYNIDPDRIGVLGHSSGAYLATMLGTTGDVKEFDKGDWEGYSSRVKAVVDWQGPIDLSSVNSIPLYLSYEAIMLETDIHDPENKEKMSAVNPATYVTKDDPSFLLMYGDKDEAIPMKQGLDFYKKLVDGGVDATFYKLIGAHHSPKQLSNDPQVMKTVKDFFDKKLK